MERDVDLRPPSHEKDWNEFMFTHRAAAEPPTMPAPRPSDETLVPTTIGGYRVLGRIGSGAMGTVYHARSDELGREVAIKVCNDPAGPQRERFLREARAVASVGHPNVPFVLERGEDAQGRPHVVFEYLRGANLYELVQRDGPQPVARVVHILQQLAAALWAVHGRGLIHRDVKPSNVVLTRQEGCHDLVKLIDFGLVLDVFEPDPDQMGPCGTPGYVAPETMAHGTRIDARADIFALGAVGHFLLLGQHVDMVDDGLVGLMTGEAEPALDHLASLLLRCLAPEPEARPDGARSLFYELRELAKRTPWHPELAERWWSSFLEEWGHAQDDGTLIQPPSWLWC